MVDSIGGRKVAAAMITLILAVAATLYKGDVPANFLQILEFVFGAFVAGNGIEHAARAFGAKVTGDTQEPAASVPATTEPAAPTIQPIDFTPVLSQLGTMQEAIANTQQGVTLLIQYVHGSISQQPIQK